MADAVLRSIGALEADAKILAVDEASGDELAPIAARHGFALFRGPKEDVLTRFALAIEALDCDFVVRATGDNPFVSSACARALLGEAVIRECDYAAYDGLPLGMGVEVARAEALRKAARLATESYDREHVMPFLYRHPDRFSIARIPAPEAWRIPSARITVDTREDYERALEALEASRGDESRLLSWLSGKAAGRG
jgi:spore coat polysaccharide biosynthesis protein SpsF